MKYRPDFQEYRTDNFNMGSRVILKKLVEVEEDEPPSIPPFPFGRLQLHPDQISKRSLERAGIEWLEDEMQRCRNSLSYAIRNKNEYGAFCYSRELARVGFEYLRRTDPTNHSFTYEYNVKVVGTHWYDDIRQPVDTSGA